MTIAPLPIDWVDDVIRFWFVELRPKDWWGHSVAVDAMVARRYSPLLERLTDAPPDPKGLDAFGHLAAVIVFDQFPRNLFRGRLQAFATDALAQALTIDAVERGLDGAMTLPQRQFLYMPLMHAEDMAKQDRALELFEQLGDANGYRSAVLHRETIVRFGRFPYRNAALGRASTDEERAFLAAHPGPE